MSCWWPLSSCTNHTYTQKTCQRLARWPHRRLCTQMHKFITWLWKGWIAVQWPRGKTCQSALVADPTHNATCFLWKIIFHRSFFYYISSLKWTWFRADFSWTSSRHWRLPCAVPLLVIPISVYSLIHTKSLSSACMEQWAPATSLLLDNGRIQRAYRMDSKQLTIGCFFSSHYISGLSVCQ